MKNAVKRLEAAQSFAAKKVLQAQERKKLIPAMKKLYVFDESLGQLVNAIDRPPRVKKGAVAGSLNNYGVRQVMFHNVRYCSHDIIYAITHDEWPYARLSFRDGDKTNIAPSNLYIKE